MSPAAYIARVTGAPAFLLINQVLHALTAAVLQGLAVVWVTQGSTAGGVVTNINHRGRQCCGQAPRPSAVAEMRVSSYSYSGENHSKNPLGT